MNKTLSFVRLDFYTLKPYLKSLALLFVLALVMTFTFRSLSTFCFYLMMCLIMVTAYPFSIGEVHKLDTLYGTLPLKRGDIVRGRYLFALCMEGIAALLVLILSWGISLFTDLQFIPSETLFYFSIASLLFSVIMSVQYPIYFKLGYNKAKFIAYLPLLLAFLLVMLLPSLLGDAGSTDSVDDFLQQLGAAPLAACGIPLLSGHLLLGISYKLARKLYSGRDV